MAKKAAPKAKNKAAALHASRVAPAGAEAPKKKSGFGKRSRSAPAAAAHAKAARSRPAPAPRSTIGKAVDAVSSTMSSVAGSATSLFRRKPAKSH